MDLILKNLFIVGSDGEIAVKGIGHPHKTYEVIAARECFQGAVRPISGGCDSFRLTVDPLALSLTDRQRARKALQSALDAREYST